MTVFAADYPFLDVLWTMIIFFCWVAWIWLLIVIFGDLFRRDISGWAKAAWVVFLIILPFLGTPMSDRDMLAHKLDYLTRHRTDDPETCARYGEELTAYLLDLIARRRAAAARDDVIQVLLDALVDGAPLTDMEVLGAITLLLFGGLDTTSGALGEALFHLARKFPHVQLIPAWVDNVQRVMPKGEIVPVPVLCTVTFGAPCNLAPDETKADFLARARAAVVALKPGGATALEHAS